MFFSYFFVLLLVLKSNNEKAFHKGRIKATNNSNFYDYETFRTIESNV